MKFYRYPTRFLTSDGTLDQRMAKQISQFRASHTPSLSQPLSGGGVKTRGGARTVSPGRKKHKSKSRKGKSRKGKAATRIQSMARRRLAKSRAAAKRRALGKAKKGRLVKSKRLASKKYALKLKHKRKACKKRGLVYSTKTKRCEQKKRKGKALKKYTRAGPKKYKNNELNRRLGRVGKPFGTVKYGPVRKPGSTKRARHRAFTSKKGKYLSVSKIQRLYRKRRR